MTHALEFHTDRAHAEERAERAPLPFAREQKVAQLRKGRWVPLLRGHPPAKQEAPCRRHLKPCLAAQPPMNASPMFRALSYQIEKVEHFLLGLLCPKARRVIHASPLTLPYMRPHTLCWQGRPQRGGWGVGGRGCRVRLLTQKWHGCCDRPGAGLAGAFSSCGVWSSVAGR